MHETYAQARSRLLAELQTLGWSVKATLKVPQASKDNITIFFRPQAVYLRGLSTWLDIRGMSGQKFVNEIQARDIAFKNIGR